MSTMLGSTALALWAALENRDLLERHQHATDILVDLVSCARCRAEHTLLTAAKTRLRLQGTEEKA